eukprot:TRINITY_DN5827_c0_g2_i1.p1 TRINITY_DN5827_c0_g2~~TRINITY_DN5827_c0_g2_i1.p1  ORF type:complete len:153 (-),score=20.33 TRINITY_DN5827_c0_g2_i1:13-471(-)
MCIRDRYMGNKNSYQRQAQNANNILRRVSDDLSSVTTASPSTVYKSPATMWPEVKQIHEGLMPCILSGSGNMFGSFCLDSSKDEKEQDNLQGEVSSMRSGPLTIVERREKIIKYKLKIMKWKLSHPLKRSFPGRSRAAKNKRRSKGRFVKST